MKQKSSKPRKTPRSPRDNAPSREAKVISYDPDREEFSSERTDEENADEEEASDPEPSDEEIHAELPAVRVDPSPADKDLNLPEAAVSPNDPLRRYLEEIRRYPLLEPDEEFALVKRLRETGDMAAAKSLVSANLRLVVKIAFEYRTFYTNLLDLIQEGNIGLMKAVSKFDPTKGARLGYYSSWWIRSYILKYLLDNFRLVKVGTTQAQKKLFYHLMREKEKLEAQGLLSGPKLIAEKLNVREKDVIEMEQRLSGRGAETSLDAPIEHQDGKPTSHLDLLADPSESALQSLENNQLLHLLKDRLPRFEETLNEKEARILHDRLLAEEPKTLQEIADLYSLTRERARQIESKVLEKLRNFLKPTLF